MASSSVTPVWLYYPNLIGYVRVLSGLASFYYAFNNETFSTFVYLYMFSYALDALDGVAARRFKQESTFGAVLDMVTDRICTAGLLAVMVWAYCGNTVYQSICVWLIMLDVGSHWLQMYSSLLTGGSSHKRLKDEPAIVQAYYNFPYALFVVCLMNETFLMMDLIITNTTSSSSSSTDPVTAAPGVYPFNLTVPAIGNFTEAMSLAKFLWNITFIVFIFKQCVSIVQMVTAAQRILTHDKNTLPSQQGTTVTTVTKKQEKEEEVTASSSAKEESATPAKKSRAASVSRRR